MEVRKRTIFLAIFCGDISLHSPYIRPKIYDSYRFACEVWCIMASRERRLPCDNGSWLYIYIVVYKLLMRCHIDYIYYICSIHIHIYTR